MRFFTLPRPHRHRPLDPVVDIDVARRATKDALEGVDDRIGGRWPRKGSSSVTRRIGMLRVAAQAPLSIIDTGIDLAGLPKLAAVCADRRYAYQLDGLPL